MRFASLALVLSFSAAPVLAAEIKVPLTGENTTISFTGTKKDGKHDGGFKSLSGVATVKDSDPTTFTAEVVIQTESLHSDDARLTGHLKGPDFFDVKSNPTAKFVSTGVRKKGELYEVTGDLTLNGQTKPVTFPAKITVEGGKLTMQARFNLDRTQFGMTYGKGKIDDMVMLGVMIK